MNRTIAQALKHVWLQETDSKEHRFVFPRLTDDIQGLYHDLKVTHDVLLTIFPEFLDVRTDLGLCALFTGLRVTALSLLHENQAICQTLLQDFVAGTPRLSWQEASNRSYFRAIRELSYTLAYIGRHDEAIHHTRQLISIDPDDHIDARSPLVLAYVRSGQFAKVLTLTREFDPLSTPELALSQILVNLVLGRESEAFKALWESYHAFPSVVREVASQRHSPATLTALLNPFSERDQAQRYWRDFGREWVKRPEAIAFVRWFLRGGDDASGR